MKPLFAVAAMLVSLAASAQDSDLAGRYTLQGAAEARSEMLLKADGTFDWRMAYGEIEFNTKGTWSARTARQPWSQITTAYQTSGCLQTRNTNMCVTPNLAPGSPCLPCHR